MKTKLKKILLGGGILSSVVGFSTPFFYSPNNSCLKSNSQTNLTQYNTTKIKDSNYPYVFKKPYDLHHDEQDPSIYYYFKTQEELEIASENYYLTWYFSIDYDYCDFNAKIKNILLKSNIINQQTIKELQNLFLETNKTLKYQEVVFYYENIKDNFSLKENTLSFSYKVNLKPQYEYFYDSFALSQDGYEIPVMEKDREEKVSFYNVNTQLDIDEKYDIPESIQQQLEKLDKWKDLDIVLEDTPFNIWSNFGKWENSNLTNIAQWTETELTKVYDYFKIPTEYQFLNQITVNNNSIELTDWFNNIQFMYQQIEPNKVIVVGVVNMKNVENSSDKKTYTHNFYFYVNTTKTLSEYIDIEFNNTIKGIDFKEKTNTNKNSFTKNQNKTDTIPFYENFIVGEKTYLEDNSNVILVLLDLIEQLPKVKQYFIENNLYQKIDTTSYQSFLDNLYIPFVQQINKNYIWVDIDDFVNNVDYDTNKLTKNKDGLFTLLINNEYLNDDGSYNKGCLQNLIIDKETKELFFLSYFIPFLNENNNTFDALFYLLTGNTKVYNYFENKGFVTKEEGSNKSILKPNLNINELLEIKEYAKKEVDIDLAITTINGMYYSFYIKKVNLDFWNTDVIKMKNNKKEELSTLNYTEITKDNLFDYFDLDYFNMNINEENYKYNNLENQKDSYYTTIKNSDFIPSNFTVKYDYQNQQTIVEYDYLQSKKQFIIDKSFFANNLQETITENINKSIENLITNTLNNENKYNYTKLDLKNIKSEIEQQIIKNTSLNQVKNSITTQIKIIDNVDKSPQLIQTYATDWDEQNNIESIKKEFNLTLNISVLNGNDNNVSFLDFNIPFKFSKDNTKLINQKQTLNNTFNNLFNNSNTTQILETNKPKEYYLTNFENTNTTINNNSFKDFFLEVFDINLDLFNKTNLYPEFTKTTNGYTLIVYDDFSNSKKIVATHTFNFDVSKLLTEKQQLENYISDIQKSFENTNDIYLSLSNVKKPDNISYLVDEKTDNSGYNITFKTQYTNIQSTIEFNPIKNDTNNTITKQNDNNIISNPFLWVGIGIGLLAIAIILYLVFKKKNKIEKIAKQKVKDGL